MYQLLGELPAGAVDWNRVRLVWGDERNVDADHADSNYRMVRENLLEHIDIPEANVWPVPGAGGSVQQAALDYERLLKSRLLSEPEQASAAWPQIDCALLGLGDDAHTASLFPHTKALHENSRWVAENEVTQLDCWRITLTAPVFNAAQSVVFLVAGSNKRSALSALWHGPRQPDAVPSQLIRPHQGELWMMLDQAAVERVELPSAGSITHVP